ncbi:hypothetical protein R1sor_023952 [Riccia sorocarpa]|uniref:Integrase catalytic domain-containing protein n=1 Tax=Riccia sorocarpa TaxID=122646 RepID=A0ABD3GT61_9MARC
MYSNVRHRDGLHHTYPLAIHFKWVVDLVTMPVGLWGMRYLVLAREDLSNQVEGHALRTKATEGVCQFLLEDVIFRYGCVGKVTVDRGELDAREAEEFFQRYGIKLALTTAYNPEDRTTHSSVTGYMPVELIQGQKSIMPVEELIPTWSVLPWVDNLTREELLELRIRQLEQRDEDVKLALERLKTTRLNNKDTFDRKHRLRPRPIEEGDWVLVYDSSLDNQHSALRKFSRRWFGPYVVVRVLDNATYLLRELDGTPLRVPIARKRMKIFKRRDGKAEFAEMAEDEEEAFEKNEDLEDEIT